MISFTSPKYTEPQVFAIFESCKVSVDVVASSDVSLSLTLDNKAKNKGDMEKLMVCTQLCKMPRN